MSLPISPHIRYYNILGALQALRGSNGNTIWDARSDMAKFNAILEFANRRYDLDTRTLNTDGNLNDTSRISFENFASLLVYVRNHIIHVVEGKKGCSVVEIKSIERVIRLFFHLAPINDTSVIQAFDDKTRMVIVDEQEIAKYKSYINLFLDSAKTRLVSWCEDISAAKIQQFVQAYTRYEINGNSYNPYSGMKLKIKRASDTVVTNGSDLPLYTDVYLKVPEVLVLRVGSRGVSIATQLLPLGSSFGFDSDKVASLAVEGIDTIITIIYYELLYKYVDPYMLPHVQYGDGESWAFDIFYDVDNTKKWMIRFAEGTQGQYNNCYYSIHYYYYHHHCYYYYYYHYDFFGYHHLDYYNDLQQRIDEVEESQNADDDKKEMTEILR